MNITMSTRMDSLRMEARPHGDVEPVPPLVQDCRGFPATGR